MSTDNQRQRYAGVLAVAALHGAALWGLWAQRPIPPAADAATLFVDFIAPPPAPPRPAPKVALAPPPPRPQPASPQARVEAPLAVPAAASAPAETAVSPAPTPAVAAVDARAAAPAGPVTLGAELAVSCPQRSAPSYPPLARRLGETGIALLRVELDEQGQVSAARVASGSGYARLDEAALAAVKTWRCTPAQRNGQPVRAIALQPFKFVLQGN